MNQKRQEDTVLIQHTLDGNQIAQKILYNKYKEIVGCYIKGKFSTYQDIEDDVSEIMIKIFVNLSMFDNTKSKFKSWVLSIAKHHMIDKWRNSIVTFTSLNDIIPVTNTCDMALYATTSDDFQQKYTPSLSTFNLQENSIEINSSISFITSKLSPADYTMLDMKYVQGYNYCEIGQEFNLTSSTVSNKVNYIKTKLKKEYCELLYD